MFAFLKLPPVLERNDGMNSFLCQFDEWPWRPAERRAETKISQWRWKEERQIFVPKRQERGEGLGGIRGKDHFALCSGQAGRAAEGAVIMAKAAAKAHYPRQKTSYGFSSPTYSVPQNPSGPA